MWGEGKKLITNRGRALVISKFLFAVNECSKIEILRTKKLSNCPQERGITRKKSGNLPPPGRVVPLRRFERPTYGLGIRCSIQLSYRG